MAAQGSPRKKRRGPDENDGDESGPSNTYVRSPEVMSKNDYYMSVARLAALRSKDPRCQVGACIVSKDDKIIGVGYNCMPRGNDIDFNWYDQKEKNKYVCHAELNAIVNSGRTDFSDCKIYCTRIPCANCAKLIIQSNIKTVIYDNDPVKYERETEEMYKKSPSFQMKKFEADDTEHMKYVPKSSKRDH